MGALSMPCLGFDPWEAMATKFQGQLHGQRRKFFWSGGGRIFGLAGRVLLEHDEVRGRRERCMCPFDKLPPFQMQTSR